MGRLIQGLVDTSTAGVMLLLFVGLFGVILLWVYRPKGQAVYEQVAKLPLSEDDK